MKRLFASVTLIAVGMAIVGHILTTVDSEDYFWITIAWWFAGGMMIGAGVMVPFKLTVVGIILGFVVQWIVGALILSSIAKFPVI